MPVQPGGLQEQLTEQLVFGQVIVTKMIYNLNF